MNSLAMTLGACMSTNNLRWQKLSNLDSILIYWVNLVFIHELYSRERTTYFFYLFMEF